MAQLIFFRKFDPSRNRDDDEVLAVLEDGVHPGRKVVEDPEVWDSRPVGDFWVVHVPGVPAADLEYLRRVSWEQVGDRRRRVPSSMLAFDEGRLTDRQRTEWARDRKITLTKGEVFSRVRQ